MPGRKRYPHIETHQTLPPISSLFPPQFDIEVATTTMGEHTPHQKKFNTELTDYSKAHEEATGPYTNNLEVDALVVGGGFGMFKGVPLSPLFFMLTLSPSLSRCFHVENTS